MDDLSWLEARNDLERALLDAAADPDDATRTSAFYAALISSELFVVADVAGEVNVVEGEATLPPGTMITPRAALIEGEEVMPIYSSRERAEAATSGELPYVAMSAAELLTNVPEGLKVVLNPGVWHGKELWPEEVQALIADLPAPEGTEIVGGHIAVGHPSEYPQRIVDRLTDLFADHPSVAAAYVAVVGLPGSPPALTIGLDMTDPSALEAVAGLIGGALEPIVNETVNVVSVAGNPVGDWMRANADPFYSA